MDKQKMLAEIKDIQSLLDKSHDTDPNYIPPDLNKLRLYILQVHASFERTSHALIALDYLKTDAITKAQPLFEHITFIGCLKLIESRYTYYPLKIANKINIIRNEFVHKRGRELRYTYNSTQKIYNLYKFLKKANDEINNFWFEYGKNENFK